MKNRKLIDDCTHVQWIMKKIEEISKLFFKKNSYLLIRLGFRKNKDSTVNHDFKQDFNKTSKALSFLIVIMKKKKNAISLLNFQREKSLNLLTLYFVFYYNEAFGFVYSTRFFGLLLHMDDVHVQVILLFSWKKKSVTFCELRKNENFKGFFYRFFK